MDFYQNSNQENHFSTNQPNRPNGFAIASMCCGLVSVLLCCTGILPICLGALSILFAYFSKRKQSPLPGMSLAGIWLSIVGIILGILMTVYSFFLVFNDPFYREQADTMMEYMYGMDLEEYMEEFF